MDEQEALPLGNIRVHEGSNEVKPMYRKIGLNPLKHWHMRFSAMKRGKYMNTLCLQ